MAVFYTGDTHGDFRRFSRDEFPQQRAMTKDDYMIICGDFGGVWNRSTEQEYNLDWMEARAFTTLFVTGNHENYDLLADYPTEEWNGGIVQRVRPTVLHLTRGQVFDIDGSRYFTMGGAACHDVDDGILDPTDPLFHLKFSRLRRKNAYFRVNHVSWWKEELPSPEEYETARRNLQKCGWTVDYVITHCAPTSIQKAVAPYGYEVNDLTEFLEEVSQKLRFHYWFFGHYHHSLIVKQKYIMLYEDIIQLKEQRDGP